MEKVLLKKKQALDLMLKRLCIPVNPNQWRPRDARLRQPGQEQSERKKIDELEQAKFMMKTAHLPSQKGK
jgi:hypothetical protein